MSNLSNEHSKNSNIMVMIILAALFLAIRLEDPDFFFDY
jgi:hypothetical protein